MIDMQKPHDVVCQDRTEWEKESNIGLKPKTNDPKLERPSLYSVVILNDDYTPMDFVVEVLEQFFNMGNEEATSVMLKVHTEGKGICGIYPKDIAETKAAKVNEYSRQHDHPLLCEIELVSQE